MCDLEPWSPPSSQSTTIRRVKLWEIEPGIHCSIIGTYLDRHDLHHITRKVRISFREDARDYEVHSYFVEAAAKPDVAGRLLHKALDAKHSAALRRVRALREGELWDYWRETCGCGRVAGGYWALLSWSHVPRGLKLHAFGDIHMLSHVMVGQNRGDAHALVAAEARVDTLARRLERVRRDRDAALSQRDARIAGLEGELREARAHFVRFVTRPSSQTPTGEPGNRERRRRDKQERRIEATRARLRSAEAEIAHLCSCLEHVAPVNAPDAQQSDVGDNGAMALRVPCNGLCLYIGGRTALRQFLEARAESRRVRLLHHDGGLEDSIRLLDDMVPKADIVFCPVDCISHGACVRAKALARRFAKPFVPLKSASASYFARTIDRFATERESPCTSP